MSDNQKLWCRFCNRPLQATAEDLLGHECDQQPDGFRREGQSLRWLLLDKTVRSNVQDYIDGLFDKDKKKELPS